MCLSIDGLQRIPASRRRQQQAAGWPWCTLQGACVLIWCKQRPGSCHLLTPLSPYTQYLPDPLAVPCPCCCFCCAEDAMDGGCIIPCPLEEWFRPVLQNNKFSNPNKLQFRYSAH